MPTDAWLLPGAARDEQTVTATWNSADVKLIDGVHLYEMRHVPKASGYLTEVLRRSWGPGADGPVDGVFQVVMNRGDISAWHAHDRTIDRLFVSYGLMRIVLFDSRPDSPTQGLLNEFKFGTVRPALVVIPPRVWHGTQNIADGPSIVLNLVDHAYDYEHPDHWRLPQDSREIPFRWERDKG